MVRPSKTGRGGSFIPKNTVKYENAGVVPLGATQEFPLLSSARIGLRNRVPPRHQPSGLRRRRRPPDFHPLVRHGRSWPPSATWVGGSFWWTTGSPTPWPRYSRAVYRRSERIGGGRGCCPHISVPTGDSTPSWRISYWGCIRSLVWSIWPYWVLTETEWCTLSTRCYPSRSTSTQQTGFSSPVRASCSTRASPWW